MSSGLAPGLAASSDVLPKGQDRSAERAVLPRKRRERDPDRYSQECRFAIHFRIPRKTAVGISAQ
jgi:hypothetical protein